MSPNLIHPVPISAALCALCAMPYNRKKLCKESRLANTGRRSALPLKTIMMNQRIQTILILLITTLFVSAFLMAELVTSASAGDQEIAPIAPITTIQDDSGNLPLATDAISIDISISPQPDDGQKVRIEPNIGEYGHGETAENITQTVSLIPVHDSVYWQFTNWSGTTTTTDIPLDLGAIQDYDITANFKRSCFDLVLGYTGVGDEGVNPTVSPVSEFCGAGQYAADETINLFAADIDGWRVAGWSGTIDDASQSYENQALFDPDNPEIVVQYEPVCYALNVAIDPADTGTVTQLPMPDCPITTPGNKYHEGTVVSLKAVADDGYEFLSWTGDTEGSTNVATMAVEMNKVRNITANFDLACHKLTLQHIPPPPIDSGGNPTASPDRSSPKCTALNEYVLDEEITLTASPNSGADWQVGGWVNTNDDESTSVINNLNFPALTPGAEGFIVTVEYVKRPTLQFKDNGYRALESIGEFTIYVKRIGSLAEIVSVDYATRNGTAKSGPDKDYLATSGTLTFVADDNEESFTVTINDDDTNEGDDEKFFVTLSDPNNAILGDPYEIEVTIEDNERPPTVNFSSPEFKATESSASAPITITLSPASTGDVWVIFDTAVGGTAGNGQDYSWGAPAPLYFPSGTTYQVVEIPLIQDELDELDETVLLTLPTIDNAERGSSTEATLTIEDDDDPPDVYFAETEYFAKEGEPTAPVTVTLSAASTFSITVDYEVTQLTVGRQLADTITFDPGEEIQVVDIPIGSYLAGDQLEIELDGAVNATLVTPSSATMTIFDKNRSDCHQLILQSSGFGSLPITTNIDRSVGCPEGYYVSGELIDVYVEPDGGWVINGWHGTLNDTTKSNENVVRMPDGDHTVTVYYLTFAYMPTIMQNYVTYFAGAEEVEPNNILSISQANGPLQSGKQYRGGFPTADDQYDVYYVFLADKGNIQVELTNIPPNRDYNLYLYTADAVLKGYSGSLDNNDELIASSNLAKGVYFIAIHFAGGNPTSGKYRVTATYD